MDYSVLNNYEYENKKWIISTLDFLSTPMRRVLGGKNDSVLSETSDYKMSVSRRIATLFFSVIVFPVAAISIASLILKLMTCPFIWEKKIVQAQDKNTWEIYNKFNDNCKKGSFDAAVHGLSHRSQLLKRDDIHKNLFSVINAEINNNPTTCWEKIPKGLKHLKIGDAIELINHAIKVRLECELKDNRYKMDGSAIAGLIDNSLNNTHLSNLEACVTKILSGALRIESNENLLAMILKMELADNLINLLTDTKKSNAHQDYQRTLADLQADSMRSMIFPSGHNYFDQYTVFRDKPTMKNIGRLMADYRSIQNTHAQTAIQLEMIGNNLEKTDQKTQSKEIQNRLDQVSKMLILQTNSSQAEEKEFFQITEKMVSQMSDVMQHVDNIATKDISLRIDIPLRISELKNNFDKNAAKLPSLLEKLKQNSTTKEAVLSTIRMLNALNTIALIKDLNSIVLSCLESRISSSLKEAVA